MLRPFIFFLCVGLVSALHPTLSAAPLRIFIRAGEKTHGPAGNGQHDHPRFLEEWSKLLTARGALVNGAKDFPTPEQLEQSDLLLMFCSNGGNISPVQRVALDQFLARGGGMAVFHSAVCGKDAEWFKTKIGGAWQDGKARYLHGMTSFYYVDRDHPITKGAANFDIDDEIYWNLDMMPNARILAAAYTPETPNSERAKKNPSAGKPNIYDVAPQAWTYETETHRAFVSLLGHNFASFEKPHVRVQLLRGIAWAGRRPNVDEFCSESELASYAYPEGGPVEPSQALAKAQLHSEFDARTIAGEPVINKPMCIDWDASGRLWVAETPEYPNGRRGYKPSQAGAEWKDAGGIVKKAGVQERTGIDRISILSDADGDGVLESKKVWFEGLDLVTGFVFHKDGVIVTQAPDVLFIRDTDGDGKGDKVERLYTGLGTSDTHAVINNPRWGFDGWVYATHGYAAGEVTSADGSRKFGRMGSGVVRFLPDGSAFEQYSSKGGNTWGLQITGENEIFWTQPTSGDLLMHTVLPEHVLARARFGKATSFNVAIKSGKTYPLMTWAQQAYRQIDHVGSFTAAAGCAIYDGGAWPAEYDGDYFTTEPTINIVHFERLKTEGPTAFGTRVPGWEENHFMRSADLWFRPIETRVGPDGALYVLDFYNQAAIHNDTRGPEHNGVNAAVRPDRDHYYGRILRIMHKKASAVPVPNLANASAVDRIAALRGSNGHTQRTAARLLIESGTGADTLNTVLADGAASATARVAALWALHRMGQLQGAVLTKAAADSDSAVSRNGLRVIAERANAKALPAEMEQVAIKRLADPDARVRLAALLALGSADLTPAAIGALLTAFDSFTDDWSRSAALAAAKRSPLAFIKASLAVPSRGTMKSLIQDLAATLAPAEAADLVVVLASLSGEQPLLVPLLEALSAATSSAKRPAWSPALQAALTSLLQTKSAPAALTLVAAWDTEGALKGEALGTIKTSLARLEDPTASPDERAQLVGNLIGLRSVSPEVSTALGRLFASGKTPDALRLRILQAFGADGAREYGAVFATAFAGLSPALRESVMNEVLKRAEWTRDFIEAIRDGKVDMNALGTLTIDRLRNHPDRQLGKFARTVIDQIRGPVLAQKNQVISQLLAQVESGGDVAKGAATFQAACAVCHKFGTVGVHLAPDLSGMGAHPRAELLTAIIDPNREVDPSFAAWSITTKKGDAYVGIVTRENAQAVTLRDQAAEREIPRADIKEKVELGRSLMPEGFEALGAEMLRDLLAYLQGADSKYRILDLSKAYTADSRQGLFSDPKAVADSLPFQKFGILRHKDVPFQIADPARAGLNLVILRGGHGHAKKNYPQKVEIPAHGVKANLLHFLSGIGGWAYPFSKNDDVCATVTVTYDTGAKEEIVLRNGVEFADYIGPVEVPGSEYVPNLCPPRQGRFFTSALKTGGTLASIELSSPGTTVAPVFIAMTAELADTARVEAVRKASETLPATKSKSAAAAPAPAPVAEGAPEAPLVVPKLPPASAGTRMLLFGGGSSHDFQKWFGDGDKAILSVLKPAWLDYTENPAFFAAVQPETDVLVWSRNDVVPPGARKALFDHIGAGRPLILLHAGVWYNWKNFPEFNRDLAGGGSRGHDRLGEFEVRILDASHPITAGLPPTFKIVDELYWFKPDPEGTPIKVLAEAISAKDQKAYPMIWTVEHPKARIAGITLGHDGQARETKEYQAILRNAANWARK